MIRDRIEAGYLTGGKPVLELLDAQRAYRDAVRIRMSAQAAYWQARRRLETSLGTRVLP